MKESPEHDVMFRNSAILFIDAPYYSFITAETSCAVNARVIDAEIIHPSVQIRIAGELRAADPIMSGGAQIGRSDADVAAAYFLAVDIKGAGSSVQ